MVGNKPNYSKFDILRCFFRIKEGISRHELAKSLELGEGTMRTILDILKAKKLIGSTKKGHFLSSSGKQILNGLKDNMSIPKNIESRYIYPNLKKSAVLAKGAKEFPCTYKLRDIAVKNGSEGAVILRFDKKRLCTPEFESDFDYKEIEQHFKLDKRDIVIMAFADSYSVAENSVLAVAAEINQALKSFIKKLFNGI